PGPWAPAGPRRPPPSRRARRPTHKKIYNDIDNVTRVMYKKRMINNCAQRDASGGWAGSCDGSPFLVGEFVAHASAPSGQGLESRFDSWAQHARPRGALVAIAPESGLVMLTLTFVDP